MPTPTQAQVLVSCDDEADRFLPEGPREVLVGGRAALAWVNIQTAADATRGDIHLRFWDTGERRKRPQTARPGFLLPTDRPNVVLVGRDKEIGTFDLLTGEWNALARIPDEHRRTMINDAEVVPGGRAIVFGTKDFLFKEPIAHLYLFTLADRRVSVLADGQVCSNGKFFARGSNDMLLLYDIDTPRQNVVRYRLDVEQRIAIADGVAIDLQSQEAFPDGMVDAGNDSAIIAFYNPSPVPAGRARRYSLSTGELLEEWTTPGSPRVTCPLLVKREGVQLLLTTAVEGMAEEQRRVCPNAGNLFIAATTLSDCPPRDFVRL
jgi:sugar lactone lactonase YvrE